ncbi:DUF397 domain-containing protein [Streptomyces sp. NPDC006326]|uniref:DUF397 domain-containing protein n=1 Tax=Streptomyces sp. NPDC006326 TaxID=3156752 RepID=UPI0033ACF9E8
MTAQPAWRKSSYCGEGEACVYVAAAPGHLVRVADRADPAHLVLATTQAAWTAFLDAVKTSDGPGAADTPAAPHPPRRNRAPQGILSD